MPIDSYKSSSELTINAINTFFYDLIPDNKKLKISDNPVQYFQPLYDVDLTFENRMQYQFTKIEYATRQAPWHAIVYNIENGLQYSDVNMRRFETSKLNDDNSYSKYNIMLASLPINIGIFSNSMLASLELQEKLMLFAKHKTPILTAKHSIIGEFNISLVDINMELIKLDRNRGSLCQIFCQCNTEFPIIGGETDVYVIEQINLKINDLDNGETLTEDIINENT